MIAGNAHFESRCGGALIIAAAICAMILVLHHPTSFNGPDDGLLLHDWSNTFVHGTMMVCLFTLMFAFAVIGRRLGEDHLEVRAGAMAFSAGMIALIAAAFLNGFVVGGLQAALINPVTAAPQFALLGVLNQKLALLGIALISGSMTLWAFRLLRMDGLTKVAGGLAIAIAALAGYWLLTGDGKFGLHIAAVSMTAFSTWSIIVAIQLFRGKL